MINNMGVNREEVIVHKDQTNMFDFMKEVNSFCEGCRQVVDNRCVCENSDFYSLDVRDEEIDFSSCLDKFDEDHSKNIKNDDENTGVLI